MAGARNTQTPLGTQHSRCLAEPVSESLRIGILGGSISWGAELGRRQNWLRYSAQLQQRLPSSKVYNRAMPATGSPYASFCLDHLLPEAVDVLVLEFNFNDAYGHDQIQNGASGGRVALSPPANMERLLRSVLRRSYPPCVIIVLAVCRGWSRCESIHDKVARHYRAQGVVKLSLHLDGVGWPGLPAHNGSHHPTKAGHSEIARLIEAELMTGSNSSHCLHSRPRCPRRLPAPLEAFPSWEAAEEGRWQCASCDYHECPGLQPLERCRQGGFQLAGVNATDRGTIFKVGWTATTAGATTCFPLDGGHAGAQVLVAMLCSYENVGAAAVRLTGPGTVDSTWQPLELRWNARASQQCVMNLGRIGPGREALLLLRMRSSQADASRGQNQLKVFGVYTWKFVRPHSNANTANRNGTRVPLPVPFQVPDLLSVPSQVPRPWSRPVHVDPVFIPDPVLGPTGGGV